MKILAWNCCMALRSIKAERLVEIGADVAVISECSRADASAFAARDSSSFVWADGPGRPDWEHKGLAVFVRPGLELSLSGEYDPSLAVMLPIEARGDESFNILAVWAKAPYEPTIVRAVERYASFLNEVPSIVLGDFNSNAALKPRRSVNHLTVDRGLNALGLQSAYHSFFGEPQGAETRPTHYYLRKRERPFHIDHCYLSQSWLNRVRDVSVGGFDDWIGSSDHVPLVVSLN